MLFLEQSIADVNQTLASSKARHKKGLVMTNTLAYLFGGSTTTFSALTPGPDQPVDPVSGSVSDEFPAPPVARSGVNEIKPFFFV